MTWLSWESLGGDPDDGRWTYEFVSPTAAVSAAGYPDTDLDLGIEV